MNISEQLILQIVNERRSQGVNLGTGASGASDNWIAKTERRLGARFPPSYKWVLKEFGGGEI